MIVIIKDLLIVFSIIVGFERIIIIIYNHIKFQNNARKIILLKFTYPIILIIQLLKTSEISLKEHYNYIQLCGILQVYLLFFLYYFVYFLTFIWEIITYSKEVVKIIQRRLLLVIPFPPLVTFYIIIIQYQNRNFTLLQCMCIIPCDFFTYVDLCNQEHNLGTGLSYATIISLMVLFL